jgi:hypothetical protein
MFGEAIAEFDLPEGFVVVLDSVSSSYGLLSEADYSSGLTEAMQTWSPDILRVYALQETTETETSTAITMHFLYLSSQ